jgi:hypothetical protein
LVKMRDEYVNAIIKTQDPALYEVKTDAVVA